MRLKTIQRRPGHGFSAFKLEVEGVSDLKGANDLEGVSLRPSAGNATLHEARETDSHASVILFPALEQDAAQAGFDERIIEWTA